MIEKKVEDILQLRTMEQPAYREVFFKSKPSFRRKTSIFASADLVLAYVEASGLRSFTIL